MDKSGLHHLKKIHWIQMDIDYKWILGQGKNCRQFSLLSWKSFIGQLVHLVVGDQMG